MIRLHSNLLAIDKRWWSILADICPTLSAPQDGYMTVSDYFVAGTANFVCHVGFGMIGAGQIICEADGFWNQQPPVCNCKYIFYYCMYIHGSSQLCALFPLNLTM